MTPCYSAVDDLFSRFPIRDILTVLAECCEREAAVASGEGRESDVRKWLYLVEQLQEIDTP